MPLRVVPARKLSDVEARSLRVCRDRVMFREPPTGPVICLLAVSCNEKDRLFAEYTRCLDNWASATRLISAEVGPGARARHYQIPRLGGSRKRCERRA
jgi:hypothetical protein